ncbi:MAG: DJ-1/PfpI family protein [bacterium]|nr:DJ-1/PfpI family protein [bacterium]
MSKRVLVPVADGIEELETVSITNPLVRAGAEVVVASVERNKQIRAARGLVIVADALLSDLAGQEWDLVVLPGGMPGAATLAASSELTDLLRHQQKSGKWYGALCASPALALTQAGVLEGKRATCYPSFANQLGVERSEEKVVIDGNCITSQGPGTALQFGLTLVELLFGPEKRAEVAAGMLVG